ncbi:unnamed protein product, partial [Ilex paraguariensis]
MANEGSNHHGVVAVIQGEIEDEVDAGVEIFGTSQALGAAAVQALGAFTDHARRCAAHV